MQRRRKILHLPLRNHRNSHYTFRQHGLCSRNFLQIPLRGCFALGFFFHGLRFEILTNSATPIGDTLTTSYTLPPAPFLKFRYACASRFVEDSSEFLPSRASVRNSHDFRYGRSATLSLTPSTLPPAPFLKFFANSATEDQTLNSAPLSLHPTIYPLHPSYPNAPHFS